MGRRKKVGIISHPVEITDDSLETITTYSDNIYKEVDKKSVAPVKSEKDKLLVRLQNDLSKARSNIIEPRGSAVFEGKVQLVNYIEALIIDLKG